MPTAPRSERAGQREQPADEQTKDAAGRGKALRGIASGDEDADADHVADDQHHGVEQAQLAPEPALRTGLWCARRTSFHGRHS
jgi:hypothetical protein